MTRQSLIIIGAGGHSKVVTEAASERWQIIAYVDEGLPSPEFLGKPVFRSLAQLKDHFPTAQNAFVAIGNNESRKKWHQQLDATDLNLPFICHETAAISASAKIAPGSFVGAKAVVGADANLEEGAIANVGSILDHDCTLGSFSHLSPGAIACGGSRIGSETTIGPGAVIEKTAEVGPGQYVPSNAVVTAQHK